MADAEASEAARQLSRARWGTRKTDRLVAELAARREQITPEAAATLRELAGEPAGGQENG